MDEIEKVLHKANKKNRARLLEVMMKLRLGNSEGLNIIKLTNSTYFRVKVGDYRIIFLIDKKEETIEIKSVLRRNEQTYK